MSEIKSLEKLRSRILLKDIFVRGERMSDNNEAYERANGYANKLADEIEAEIAEKYMELPVDADGVPVSIGDELTRPMTGGKAYEVEELRYDGDTWWYESGEGCFACDCASHVKPDPLKELVIDAMQFGYLNDLPQEMWDDKANEFAERIREMMKDGGE